MVTRFVGALKLVHEYTNENVSSYSSKGQLDDRLKRQGTADGKGQGPLRSIYLLGVHIGD
jgi:hypothetical protein